MSEGRKKGTERRQVRAFARTRFEADLPVFKSNTKASHSSWHANGKRSFRKQPRFFLAQYVESWAHEGDAGVGVRDFCPLNEGRDMD